MKLWERVIEARLRREVTINEQQHGIMLRKSTTDAVHALLVEKIRRSGTVSVDLKRADGSVPREDLWYCMMKSGVAEKYVLQVVQDMCEDSKTRVRCMVGVTDGLKVGVGLHQG